MLLQTLRMLEHVEGPFLIVVPLSTLPHWERELELWTDFYTVAAIARPHERERRH